MSHTLDAGHALITVGGLGALLRVECGWGFSTQQLLEARLTEIENRILAIEARQLEG